MPKCFLCKMRDVATLGEKCPSCTRVLTEIKSAELVVRELPDSSSTGVVSLCRRDERRHAIFCLTALQTLVESRMKIAFINSLKDKIDANSSILKTRELTTHERREYWEANRNLMTKLQSECQDIVRGLFRRAVSYRDVLFLLRMFLKGVIPGTPWSSGYLMPESNMIFEQLLEINNCGVITYESQPSGCEETFAPNVTVKQFAYLELSAPRGKMLALQSSIEKYNRTIRKDENGKITIILPEERIACPSKIYSTTDVAALRRCFQGRDDYFIEDSAGYTYTTAHPFENSNRYFNQMLEMVSEDRRGIFNRHLTFVLTIDDYTNPTKLFDLVLEMLKESNEEDELRGIDEETGISHLSDL